MLASAQTAQAEKRPSARFRLSSARGQDTRQNEKSPPALAIRRVIVTKPGGSRVPEGGFATDQEFFNAGKEAQDEYMEVMVDIAVLRAKGSTSGWAASAEKDSAGSPILRVQPPNLLPPVWVRGPLPSGHTQCFVGADPDDETTWLGWCYGRPGMDDGATIAAAMEMATPAIVWGTAQVV